MYHLPLVSGVAVLFLTVGVPGMAGRPRIRRLESGLVCESKEVGDFGRRGIPLIDFKWSGQQYHRAEFGGTIPEYLAAEALEWATPE